MKAAERRQLKFRVDPATASALKKYCSARDITETSVLQAALQQYLAGTSDHEVLFRRLDRIAHELGRAGAALESLGEMFGTFVQLWLAHNPEIAEHEKLAAQRDVARRYRRFLAHVVRTVREGRTNMVLYRLVGAPVPVAADEELDRARSSLTPALASADPAGGA